MRTTRVSKMKKIRYGVIGLGDIAQSAVLPAFQHAKANSVLSALITNDPQKARVLSKRYKVDTLVDEREFDQFIQLGLIDALYIALPNTLHFDFAMKALKAGVHVLCEKPVLTSSQDARKLQNLLQSSKAKFMTAYRCHFDPANLQAIEICRRGDLGDLRYFTSDFSYQLENPDNIRVKPELGGGVLWDIGIYCLNAARHLFNADPVEVYATSLTRKGDRRFEKSEEMVSAILKFPNERVASFTCSFGSDSTADFRVFGSKGHLILKNAYEYAEKRELTTVINGRKKHHEYALSDQFAPELTYFSQSILKDHVIEPSLQEGVADMLIVQAMYQSIQKGRPVTLKGPERKTRGPRRSMRAHSPPVRKPQEVDAHPPHS